MRYSGMKETMAEDKVVKMSININKKLLDSFKIYCIKKEITMTEKIMELIMEELKNG